MMKRLFLAVAIFFVVGFAFAAETRDIFALCKNGTPSEIMTAVKAGADVHAKDKDGRTPLMIAGLFNKDPDVITILVNLGSDVGAQDNSGNNAFALSTKNPNHEVRAAIESFGGTAPVPAPTQQKTPTQPAPQPAPAPPAPKTQEVLKVDDKKFFELCHKGTLEQVQAAINGGSNVNAKKAPYDWTPLMYAAERNTPEVIKTLIAAGADVNARGTLDTQTYTALMEAARYNPNPEVIKALIAAGADVNARTSQGGLTVLMRAVGKNESPNQPEMITNPEVIKVLIDSGADVNARTDYYSTALMTAAAQNTNPEVIKVLIENGADVNMQDKDGDRAINYVQNNKNAAAIRAALTQAVK